ncbi:MAG: patatin-like phospholipase family protein [Lysobacter sp.]|nr:patatin-like phospholipase family protein [Lysobacter sp.]
MTRKPRIGLALGSGSARGWSHIGVIRALEEAGISPEIVCGTSIGALVGAAYAAGEIGRLHDWVKGLRWQSVVGMVDLRMNGGLIEGGKLVDFFRAHFRDEGIALLPKAFGCVATELSSGREIWLRDGPVIDSVRASIALPGLFRPVERDGRLLVDGGLVNPVPVSLCRAMGADIVIAVDLNWDLIGRRHWMPGEAGPQAPGEPDGLLASFFTKWRATRRDDGGAETAGEAPSLLEVLSTSLNIMQVRITQSRLAGEPADAMIRPRLAGIAAMDYHRAEVAIAEGERAARRALPQIAELLGKSPPP